MIVLENVDTRATVRGNEMPYLVRYNQGTRGLCIYVSEVAFFLNEK